MPPEAERPLTTRQAARILGVSTSTVVGYANRGVLRTFRLPSGHRRFRRADVEALLDPGRAA
jgi:excisionase family DNA binding protein